VDDVAIIGHLFEIVVEGVDDVNEDDALYNVCVT
jgi:hypothetical protein